MPTPAAARYIATGEPSPPAPMQSTLAAFSFFCPSMPTSGRIRWRLYRLISSALSAGSGGAAVAPVPPATEGMMLSVSPGFTFVCSFSRYRMSSSFR